MSSTQCEAPQVCVEGGCVETACQTDRDCPTGTGCASGQCVAGGGSGEASGDAGADAADTATDTAESDAGSGAADTAEEDGSGSEHARREIPYTDFPMQAISLYACWDGEHWVIMLPSEY